MTYLICCVKPPQLDNAVEGTLFLAILTSKSFVFQVTTTGDGEFAVAEAAPPCHAHGL